MVSWTVGSPAGRRGAFVALADKLGAAARLAYRQRAGIAGALRSFVRFVLIVAGLALATAAAWAVVLPLGLLAAGASCWILEAILRPESASASPRRQ